MTPTFRASLVPALLLGLLAACESRMNAGELDLDADGSAGDDTSGADGGDGGVNADGGDGDSGSDGGETDAVDPDASDATDPDGSGADTSDSGTDTDATDDTSDPDASDVVDPDADDTGDSTGSDTTDPGDTTGSDTTDPGDTTGSDATGSDTTTSDTIGSDTVDPGDTTADVLPDAAPFCGNNLIEAGEVCDGSSLGGESCATLSFVGGELTCVGCTFDTSACGSSDVCGDNIVGDSEECDIGDAIDGDGCTALCQICTEDAGEPNDLLTQYKSVAYPSTNSFVSQTGDLDYFRVLLGPGCSLDATIEFDVAGPALGVTVFTTSGVELATGVAGTTGLELDWADPTPGFSSQYVLIEVESLEEGGCVDYSVVVRARCG